jgi:endonuclease/exonuclease/phosphatase family metal-dependent hydrolase
MRAWMGFVVLVTIGIVGGNACGDGDANETTTTTASVGSGGAGIGGGGPGGLGGGGASSMGGAGTGGDGAGPVGTCGIGSMTGAGGGGGVAPTGPVRVVAANLTSGNNQSYDGSQGVRILQGLDADVVLLQEMNFGSNSKASIDQLVENICEGDDCVYQRGPRAQIPNGVISRLPILECGSWFDPEVDNRNFVWARIDVPGDADLWAISVHLLSSNATKRQQEAMALLDEISEAIPSSDLIVLGGDLNTTSRGEAAIGVLSQIFETSGPFPEDQNGNDNTNEPRSEPYDWVLADADLASYEVAVTIGQTVFPAGAVIDTRIYQPLSEIAPALGGDSGAPSMQHMAVVKDFVITP